MYRISSSVSRPNNTSKTVIWSLLSILRAQNSTITVILQNNIKPHFYCTYIPLACISESYLYHVFCSVEKKSKLTRKLTNYALLYLYATSDKKIVSQYHILLLIHEKYQKVGHELSIILSHLSCTVLISSIY